MTSRIGIVRLGLEAIVLIVATEALLLGWMALRASRSASVDVVWQIALEIAVVGLWIRWRSPALRNREAASVSATAKAGRIGGSPNVLAMLLLLAGIVCTILTAHWLQRTVDAAAEAKYERQKDRLVSEVQRRFRQPVYGMMGGRGVYAAGARVDRAAWQGYVRSRDLAQEFPGVRGFGVIERVPRSDIDRFVAARRADGQPDFELRTAGNLGPELYVIKYVEPLDTNRTALGLDAGSELTRRQAIEQAIWTGQPTLSGRLALVQDNEQGAGFLYMVPVYRAGVVLDTPTQREAALTAIVYAPIVASELLNGILDSIDSQLVFSLFDGEEGADHAVFSAGKAQMSSLVERLAWRPQPTVERSLDSLVIGGRQFWIRTAPAFDFWPALDYWSPSLLRVAGTCISALLALAVWLLASGGARARALAQSMTADLRRMAEVVRHTSNAVVVTDRERRILWANAGFTRLYGYSMDEAQGVTPSVLLGSGRTDPSVHAAIDAADATGQSCRVEVINRSKDGREFWVDLEIQPHHDELGRLVGFMEIGQDITAMRSVREELRRSNVLLRSIVDNLPCGLSVFDANLKLVAHNAAYRELLALPPELLLAPQATFDAIIRHNAERGDYGPGSVDEIVARLVAGAQVPRHMRSERQMPDGRELEVRSAPMPGGGFVTTYMDITERRHMERLKSEFVSTVTHELRTPMTSIHGALSLLASGVAGPMPEGAQELIKRSHQSSDRLVRLVNDVLDVERIESRLMRYSMTAQPLAPLVDQAIDSTRAYADEHGVEFDLQAHSDDVRVLADADRIVQVVVNLLSNAVKFAGPSKRVSIRTAATGLGVRVSVIDDGAGIPESFRPRIFERFSQADSSDRRQKGGTGLGLNICRSIIDEHGGRIDYISILGEGSEFYFELPIVEAP